MNRIRLFLVRHGQTDYNLKHLLQGSGINSSLNQTGQDEAQKLKDTGKLLMKTDIIYSSPLERAVQTGEIVTGLKRDRNGPLKSNTETLKQKIFVPEGMNFDPVKYVKETSSHVEYACDLNLDPLARHFIFSRSSDHVFKMKIHYSNNLKVDQAPF